MSDEERLARRAGTRVGSDADFVKAFAIRTNMAGAQAEVGNRIYAACIGLFEALERAGKVRGNGHHMAQAAVEAVVNLLPHRWVDQIPWPNAGIDLLLPGRYYRVRVVQDVTVTFEGDLRPLIIEADARGIVVEHVPGDGPAEPVCRVMLGHGVAPVPARLLAPVPEPLTDLEQRLCAAGELSRVAQRAGQDYGHAAVWASGQVTLAAGQGGYTGQGGNITFRGGDGRDITVVGGQFTGIGEQPPDDPELAR